MAEGDDDEAEYCDEGKYMTTIAWDGTTLAADRLAVYGCTRRRVRKLFVCQRFLYGGSGILSDAYSVFEWLQSGADNASAPSIADGGTGGIVVDRKSGRAFIASGAPLRLVSAGRMWASGSGMDFALAAMALGRNAVEAVRLAARFDIHTGGGVDSATVAKGRRS